MSEIDKLIFFVLYLFDLSIDICSLTWDTV